MTSRPHDALFKAAFEDPRQLAGLCQGLLPPELFAAIDWATATHEPGSFVDPELADRHGDLLFTVELNRQRAHIYVLIEHQSSADPGMALRVLVYLARIWERHAKRHGLPLPPILAMIVSHDPAGWSAPLRFHDLVAPAPDSIPGLADFIPDFSVLIEDLTTRDDDELMSRALSAFPKLALWLLRDGRQGAPLGQLERWAPVMRDMLRMPTGAAAMNQLLRYICLVAGEMQFVEVHDKLDATLPEANKTVRTIAEALREEGLIRGRQEGHQAGRQAGRQEGHQAGRRDTLVELIVLKFGAITADQRAQIMAASPATLETYVQRILSAPSTDQLLR